MILLFLISLLGFVFLGVPISFSLLGSALVMMLGAGGEIVPQVLVSTLIKGMNNFAFLAVPFFMVAGKIMNHGGISHRLVRFANSLVGHFRGGIGYVSVITCMIFAGVSGSAVADTTAVGSVVLPMMKRNGYDTAKSTALISAAGCIGPIIPPSLTMILYGVTANVSILKLFLGGIIPGVIIGLVLMSIWYFHSKKNNYPSSERATLKQIGSTAKESIWALIFPVIVMGSILVGIATPTEAAVIAIVYSLIVSIFIYKQLKFEDLPRLLTESALESAIIMLVIAAANSSAYQLTLSNIPYKMAILLTSMTDNVYMIVLLINILMLLVGCVMDMSPAVLILTPVLMPILKRFNLDPIWFGVVLTVNLSIGLLTPPVGNVLYAGCGLSGMKLKDLIKALPLCIAGMIIVLILISYIPQLVTFIPNL